MSKNNVDEASDGGLPPRTGSPSSLERRSPADICLKKTSTWVCFDPTKDVLELEDNLHQVCVNVEHRAWVCPFCEQSTEYWLVNGVVVLGCGMSSMGWMGKWSDCCDRLECRNKQEKFHQENANCPSVDATE